MGALQACDASIRQLEELYRRCGAEMARANEVLQAIGQVRVASNHPLNVVLPLLYGAAACLISTNEQVNKFLHDIHDKHANNDGIIGTLLGHKGDRIDKALLPDGSVEYINRAGTTDIPFGMHRLFYGHDPFSVSGDNPFLVLMKQHGVLKGVLQVFKHLVADTFSKQGLPIPFHSFFDYPRPGGSGGPVGNLLYDYAQSAANGSSVNAVTAFGHMFTVKAADIGTTGLNAALCAAHNRLMNRDDRAAASQVRLIAYSTQFFGKAAIGALQTGGVPFVSWPTAMAVIKELFVFANVNLSELRELERITERLAADNLALERQVVVTGSGIASHAKAAEYINEQRRFDKNMVGITSFFEEL